jgi:hypothetical protein
VHHQSSLLVIDTHSKDVIEQWQSGRDGPDPEGLVGYCPAEATHILPLFATQARYLIPAKFGQISRDPRFGRFEAWYLPLHSVCSVISHEPKKTVGR